MLTALPSYLRDRRLPSVLLALGVMVTLVRWPRIGMALIAGGLLIVALHDALARCRVLAAEARHELTLAWQGWLARWVSLRTATPTPAWFELTWYGVVLLWMLVCFLPGLLGTPAVKALAWVTTGLGAVEWTLQAFDLARRAWARAAGKVLWGALTALFWCVAAAWARELTFRLTGEDPAVFPSFVALVTVVLVPLVWWGVLCTAGAVWAGLRALCALIAFFGCLARDSHDATGAPTGLALAGVIKVFRPMSALMMVTLVTLPTFPPALVPGTWLYQSATVALAGLDYWPRSVCQRHGPVRAVRLDDRRYSIITPTGPRTVTCGATSPIARNGANVSSQ